jgi:hypothetical protein
MEVIIMINEVGTEVHGSDTKEPVLPKGYEIITGEISYEVSFTDSLGHHHKNMYKQEELITATKLKQTTLASKINLINSKTNDLCQYFNKFMKENAQYLPRTITVTKSGR